MGYREVILADRPYAYWRMGSFSGTSMLDESGNGRTLSLNNIIAQATLGALVGDSNPYMTSSNVNNSYSARINASMPWAGSFSLELWVRHTLTGFQRLCGGAPNPATTYPAVLALNYDAGGAAVHNGFVAFYDDVGGADSEALTCSGATLVNDGRWHLIHAVRDTAQTKLLLHLDGHFDASRTEVNPSNTDTAAFAFGTDRYAGAANSNYTGDVDEIAIYNYALSPEQIRRHYLAGKGLGYGQGIWTPDRRRRAA